MLICFALKEEAAPFRKMAAGGLRRGRHVSILLTGIGRKNAEKSIREFLAGGASTCRAVAWRRLIPASRLVSSLAPPSLVLTCGFAGGLNPDLKLGEVVFELSGSFSSRSRGDETLIKKNLESPNVVSYEKLIAAGAKPAKIFCADRVATTVAEKKKLREETGADAVEMESAAIYTVCREHGIPCATIRAISDTADEDLPLDFNALAKPDMSLDYGKLIWSIAKSPGKIGGLLRLQKRCRFAAEQLAGVLAKITFP